MYRRSISRHRVISWNARRTARENGSMAAAFRAGGSRGSFTRTAIELLKRLEAKGAVAREQVFPRKE
jgi:hypothetical protein